MTGLCAYCGSCAGACPRSLIGLDEELEEPVVGDASRCTQRCNICYDVCPGKDIPIPDLERMVFGRVKGKGEREIGIHQGLYRACAADPLVREVGGTGGCGTTLLKYAFETGLIDGAIIAAMSQTRPLRAEARLITSAEEVSLASQSKYVVIPINGALAQVKEKKLKRVMVSALPCHAHGIRKGQALGLKQFESVKYVLGIACGMNAPHEMTEHMVAELCEPELDRVAKVEYRAGQYPGVFKVTRKDGSSASYPNSVRRLFMWCFLRDRCAVCYDWGAELADIALADYTVHSPEEQVSQPFSTLIVRSSVGKGLVEGAQSSGYLELSRIPREAALGNLGIEFKKHGFGYHLKSRARWGWPVPDFHEEIRTDPLPRKIFTTHPSTK